VPKLPKAVQKQRQEAEALAQVQHHAVENEPTFEAC